MSSGGGYVSSAPQSCPCEELVFEAILQSPVITVVGLIKPGDQLRLNKQGVNGPVVAAHSSHGDVGSIITRIANLLRCIDEGFSYQAEVLSVSGTQVRVRVRPQ